MSLAGCQINPFDVNFYLQKSLEIFDKNSADKIWSKKDKEIKVFPLMPIRVKLQQDLFCSFTPFPLFFQKNSFLGKLCIDHTNDFVLYVLVHILKAVYYKIVVHILICKKKLLEQLK